VVQRACPLFVPLVEEGWFDHPAAELIAADYLREVRGACVRSLVLGCTHYPLLKPLLQRVMGPEVRLIDSGQATAAALETILTEKSLAAPGHSTAQHRFVVSDDEARFRQVGARFVGERLGHAEVVSLG
jgi:glutamate racemase